MRNSKITMATMWKLRQRVRRQLVTKACHTPADVVASRGSVKISRRFTYANTSRKPTYNQLVVALLNSSSEMNGGTPICLVRVEDSPKWASGNNRSR